MNRKLASLLALLLFGLLVLGSSVASAQSPDGAPHDRVQQQRAPAACPPDIQWGCALSGSTTPGLTLNSTSTTSNSSSLYATLTNPGTGSAAVWGRVLGSTSPRGYGVYGSHQGSGYGVYGNSNTGIGFFGFSNTNTGMQGETNSTGNRPGILGLHRATTGTGAGVEGRTNSASANAVGVLGVVSSTSEAEGSAGVRGINNATDGYGVYGTSPSSIGVYGSSSGGIGVEGSSSSNIGVSGSSTSDIGVYGYSYSSVGVSGSSTSDIGVYGRGLTIGVDGLSSSSTGAGVRGRNDNNGGVAGFGVYGVYGEGYTGIIGRANGRDIGTRAATFYGAVHVEGSFSVAKGTKNFLIDHPLDPENQYLQHAAIESSEVLNQYMGNVVLDANGEAVVELPVWFEAINTNFRYQLTPIGPTTSVLYIAEEIQGNRFKIGGGTAGQKVSWLVAATRSDPYMQANPFQVEVPKPADERGTYLYPEGYGQPESRGEDYEDQQRMRQMQDDAPLAPEEAPGQ